MSRTFTLPTNSDNRTDAIANKTVECLKSLRSSFSGSGTPSSGIRVGGMVFVDEDDGSLRIRNVADSANYSVDRIIEKVDERGWSAAAFTVFVLPPAQAAYLERIRIVSTTATTSSSNGVTDYDFDVYNVTDSVSMFSALPGTGNSVGGIGGGEIAANTVYDLTPDQNSAVAASDVLEFRVAVNGSPTSLTRVAVYAFWIPDHS